MSELNDKLKEMHETVNVALLKLEQFHRQTKKFDTDGAQRELMLTVNVIEGEVTELQNIVLARIVARKSILPSEIELLDSIQKNLLRLYEGLEHKVITNK